LFAPARFLAVLWPGLPQLWFRGALAGLAMAVSFAALLNTALLSTFVWTEFLAPPVRWGMWLAVTVFWILSALVSLVRFPIAPRRVSPALAEDLFKQVQSEYLRGNWFEAERGLLQLARGDVEDVGVQLLLARVFTRTGRLREAAALVKQLNASEVSAKWRFELSRQSDELAERARQPPPDVQTGISLLQAA